MKHEAEVTVPNEITAEDILRAHRFHDEMVYYKGLMETDIVLDLLLTKFKFESSTHFYRLKDGKMGYYIDKGDWVTVYEVIGNKFWVRKLAKDNFLTLYGKYISMIQPENTEKAEIDEDDTLARAVELSKIVKSIKQDLQNSQD